MCGPDAPHFTELEATFAKHHPSGEHHHLSHIATLPSAQGHGAGAALLRHHFRTYPAWDAYLEAASLRLTALYSRHGFVGRGTFVVGHGPTFWPMWRPASTARATDLSARGPMMSFPPPTA
ncbi:N-acetyltransferase [Kutzneria sp. 744]|uniref:GNAT family N-acetyltransferase n=1 Tax=Kutzneria sp. (strain 744) TaxID=345341 RepID=UPI0003EEA500|nr:GNAT family N-acetyltransferase [Kutzneria sp. 744]EWM19833.1 hypothetical protein KUTG_10137 [Kutzneria sp. 744]